MSDQKASTSFFSDQNPLFSNNTLSSNPIDWNNLSNNSTNGLIDICHELRIPIKEPIVKRELINSITSYLKNNNIPSLSFSSSYDHINSLFPNSPNNQKMNTLNRIPETYSQQMPSISSFFGTSSSFQPLSVSPFSQMLKKWKQQSNSNQTAATNQATSNQKAQQKTLDFKPSNVYHPTENNNKNNSNENNRNYYSNNNNNNKNKNKSNKFIYTKEDNSNDFHQQNKVEQFLPSPKSQRQRQNNTNNNYSKQNSGKNQQNQQQQKNLVIPEPSQIVVNKNALQNNQDFQTRNISIPTTENNQNSVTSNNLKISNVTNPNKSLPKSNLKITNSPINTNTTPNSNKPTDFVPTNKLDNSQKANNSNKPENSIKPSNSNKPENSNKPSNPNKFENLTNENNNQNAKKNTINFTPQKTKTNNSPKNEKVAKNQFTDNPFSSLQETEQSIQIQKEAVQSDDYSSSHEIEEKKENKIEISKETEIIEKNEIETKEKENSNGFIQKINGFISNLNKSNESSETNKKKGKKEEVVYEEIVKEKKKKRVLLSFYGITVQQQKMFFRIMLIVLHVVLFLVFICLNGFQLSIPYRI